MPTGAKTNAAPQEAPLLVLIVGLPCTGKTTIARRVAEDLALPLIGKDEIKELLFDHLGCRDREWSKQLGGAAFELLYWSLEKMLAAGSPVIVDVDFSNPGTATQRFVAISKRCSFRALQLNFIADGEVLLERFQRRSLSGERHPGHVDHANFAEFGPTLLKGRRETIDLPGTVVEVDATDFGQVPYVRILTMIREAL